MKLVVVVVVVVMRAKGAAIITGTLVCLLSFSSMGQGQSVLPALITDLIQYDGGAEHSEYCPMFVSISGGDDYCEEGWSPEQTIDEWYIFYCTTSCENQYWTSGVIRSNLDGTSGSEYAWGYAAFQSGVFGGYTDPDCYAYDWGTNSIDNMRGAMEGDNACFGTTPDSKGWGAVAVDY